MDDEGDCRDTSQKINLCALDCMQVFSNYFIPKQTAEIQLEKKRKEDCKYLNFILNSTLSTTFEFCPLVSQALQSKQPIFLKMLFNRMLESKSVPTNLAVIKSIESVNAFYDTSDISLALDFFFRQVQDSSEYFKIIEYVVEKFPEKIEHALKRFPEFYKESGEWIERYTQKEKLIKVLNDFIASVYKPGELERIINSVELLSLLHDSGIEPLTFYNTQIQTDLKKEVRHWRNDKPNLIDYYFIFDLNSKFSILKIFSLMEMCDQFERNYVMHSFVSNYMIYTQLPDFPMKSAYLLFEVDRHNILDEVCELLKRNLESLKKPMKVKFKDEEGMDQGGVLKEFFQLLLYQFMDFLFEFKEDEKVYWFKEANDDFMYTTFGIVLGLQLYNGIILNSCMPSLLYKLLVGENICFEDFSRDFPVKSV